MSDIFSDVLQDRLLSALRSPESVQELSDTIEAAAQSGGGSLSTVTVSVSSPQLLACDSTPVQLIAAPGAGQVLVIHSIYLTYDYGTTDYTLGDVVYVGVGASSALNLGVLTQSQNCSQLIIPSSSLFLAANQPAVLTSNGSVTGGNGTLKLKINYSIEQFQL